MVKTVETDLNAGSSCVECLQQDGNERGLPVVAVEDVRHAEYLGSLQHGAAVEGKAVGIVGVIAQRGAVQVLAVEERRVVNEVILDAGLPAPVQTVTKR